MNLEPRIEGRTVTDAQRVIVPLPWRVFDAIEDPVNSNGEKVMWGGWVVVVFRRVDDGGLIGGPRA